ncbi:MAG: hypothetical protein ACE14P_09105 [Methanotrichaceae archaeon]
MNISESGPVYVDIPADLFREFKKTPRIIIRHPTLIGVPVSELLDPELVAKLKGFDIIAVPKEFTKMTK